MNNFIDAARTRTHQGRTRLGSPRRSAPDGERSFLRSTTSAGPLSVGVSVIAAKCIEIVNTIGEVRPLRANRRAESCSIVIIDTRGRVAFRRRDATRRDASVDPAIYRTLNISSRRRSCDTNNPASPANPVELARGIFEELNNYRERHSR